MEPTRHNRDRGQESADGLAFGPPVSSSAGIGACGFGLCRFRGFVLVMALVAQSLLGMAREAVVLPVEIAGRDGVTESVSIDLPGKAAGTVRKLRLQVHGLEYQDMASVQINSSAWFSLNNETVTVAEPARSYGGIGGGFATLKLSLVVPAGSVLPGANVIRFRFNRSDGVVSGFRVLAFNFETQAGEKLLPPETFVEENPDAWSAPLEDVESRRQGALLWRSAPLRAGSLAGAPAIQARCADCHAADGRDLKYFNYSNRAIIARAVFHGLSQREGREIASYIRKLPGANPGRPWNPPYQPGPGLDARPAANWAAGAGLVWALDEDVRSLDFIFAPAMDFAGLASRIHPETFRPDGDLNPREIPIALQLPDWNHWLPRLHPLDAWGSDFLNSDFHRIYQSRQTGANSLEKSLGAASRLGMADAEKAGRATGRAFEDWSVARAALLKRPLARLAAHPAPELGRKIYSTELWQLVKTWEMEQAFGRESAPDVRGGLGEYDRNWLNTVPSATAPASAGIPNGPIGMGGSALVNEYFNNAWYELQLLLANGNHRHDGKKPIDWVYFMGRMLELEKVSRHPEPGRALVAIIKAMQSTDPKIGPASEAHGWRPALNVSPAILVSPAWQPVFEPLPEEVRKVITQAMLQSWLEKNRQYSVAEYFQPGLAERRYKTPVFLGTITGGRVWEAASEFQAAGVGTQLLRELADWRRDYMDTASRFSY